MFYQSGYKFRREHQLLIIVLIRPLFINMNKRTMLAAGAINGYTVSKMRIKHKPVYHRIKAHALTVTVYITKANNDCFHFFRQTLYMLFCAQFGIE
jgi:hypothetical protein